jgi:hypothetical protein
MLRSGAIERAGVPAVALLWVGLYHLNGWLFAGLEDGAVANWIFLPAALRLIAVLVLGWRGMLGLYLGAMATNATFFASAWSDESLGAAAVSALAPGAAVALTRGRLDLRPDLSGLSPYDLILLANVSAICSALLHSAYLQWLGYGLDATGSPVAMYVGNVVGTVLALYLARGVMALCSAR